VTKESGCSTDHRPGYGLGVRIADLSGDGRLDIFVGNDSTDNFLFRNLGALKFEEVGVVSGIASNFDGGTQATMGIALADVDANGRPDVYTTNFSSDTDTLHLNLDGRFFEDRTSQFGLAMATWAPLSWGAGFYDFDSDGDEDLFIACGHVFYPEAATQKIDSDYLQPPQLFERAGARFDLRPEAGAMFRTPEAGRAAAFGDLDDDGDVDVVMTALNRKVHVFRNDSPRRDVLVVELRGASGTRHVPGSAVELSGPRAQRRFLGGGSFQSVDAPAAYFGLPDGAADAPTLVVTWPGGRKVEVAAVPRNRRITITDGEAGYRSTALAGRGPAGTGAAKGSTSGKTYTPVVNVSAASPPDGSR
jgi:hypothetical protein